MDTDWTHKGRSTLGGRIVGSTVVPVFPCVQVRMCGETWMSPVSTQDECWGMVVNGVRGKGGWEHQRAHTRGQV